MLGRIAVWRHVVVGLVVAVCSLLALTGIIGAGKRDEVFDAKQIVVQPAGSSGVQIRETVDEDFGTTKRHGYERIIPNDFGIPVNISASSPNASAKVSVAQVSAGTRIRLGDADKTIDGRHRYVLTYTLPKAQLDTGKLALDIIGNDEKVQTNRFDVVVTGIRLSTPLCNVGAVGASGGCTLAADGDVYRTTISPLKAGQGITIGGTVVGTSDPVDVPAPPFPSPRPDHRLLLTGIILPAGLITAAAVFLSNRRRGRNEVFAGGAATAAFGAGPARGGVSPLSLPDLLPPEAPLPPPTAPTVLVADSKMAALATTEFAPPKGLEPWQGAILLNEQVTEDTIKSWFSGLAGHEALTLTDSPDGLVISPGPKLDTLNPVDREIVDSMLDERPSITLGKYDPSFASAWAAIRQQQTRALTESGWWQRPPSKATGVSAATIKRVGLGAIIAAVWFGGIILAFVGQLRSPVFAVLLGIGAPGIAAYAVYAFLLPARSATGSALALRTESFRRFLAASEGPHVDWAWKHGLLREYSGWAVALGAADAWNRALHASTVPPSDPGFVASPLLVYSMGSSMSSSHVAPPPPSSSSGGGGFSGGFSGGSVGGGGGGGSSGSW